MKIFSALYRKMMHWAQHKHAAKYLTIISFAESSFFPLPPDLMLAPMVLARPERAWYYASITTGTSVLGGILGYVVGYYFFEWLQPYIALMGYEQLYQQVLLWFQHWGIWIIFLAGFSPIPYKLFTVAGGVFGLPLLPFTLASFVGRGGRFFMVAGLLKWGGVRFEKKWQPYLDHIGWISVLILMCLGLLLWWLE